MCQLLVAALLLAQIIACGGSLACQPAFPGSEIDCAGCESWHHATGAVCPGSQLCRCEARGRVSSPSGSLPRDTLRCFSLDVAPEVQHVLVRLPPPNAARIKDAPDTPSAATAMVFPPTRDALATRPQQQLAFEWQHSEADSLGRWHVPSQAALTLQPHDVESDAHVWAGTWDICVCVGDCTAQGPPILEPTTDAAPPLARGRVSLLVAVTACAMDDWGRECSGAGVCGEAGGVPGCLCRCGAAGSSCETPVEGAECPPEEQPAALSAEEAAAVTTQYELESWAGYDTADMDPPGAGAAGAGWRTHVWHMHDGHSLLHHKMVLSAPGRPWERAVVMGGVLFCTASLVGVVVAARRVSQPQAPRLGLGGRRVSRGNINGSSKIIYARVNTGLRRASSSQTLSEA